MKRALFGDQLTRGGTTPMMGQFDSRRPIQMGKESCMPQSPTPPQTQEERVNLARLERTLGVNPGPSLSISGPTPFMSPIPYTARFP